MCKNWRHLEGGRPPPLLGEERGQAWWEQNPVLAVKPHTRRLKAAEIHPSQLGGQKAEVWRSRPLQRLPWRVLPTSSSSWGLRASLCTLAMQPLLSPVCLRLLS